MQISGDNYRRGLRYCTAMECPQRRFSDEDPDVSEPCEMGLFYFMIVAKKCPAQRKKLDERIDPWVKNSLK